MIPTLATATLLLTIAILVFASASSSTAMSLKNAVVTGANRGLGLELCRQLLEQPAYGKVYALCRKSSPELASLASNDKVSVVEDIDVMSESVGSKLATFFGTADSSMTPIDLLVHNAGAYGPPEKESATMQEVYSSQNLANITAEKMLYAFQLNSLSPLLITQALLPNLRAAPLSKVIVISSLMGSIHDNTSGGAYGYRTAKAAVNMIGKSLSADLAGDNIAVGLVHPGFVYTGFGGIRNAEKRAGQRDVEESTTGVMQAIDKVNMENTGCFLHGNYGEGVKELSW